MYNAHACMHGYMNINTPGIWLHIYIYGVFYLYIHIAYTSKLHNN